GTTQSSVTFTATAGTTYQIAVDGYGGASGNITLNWSGAQTQAPTITSQPASTTINSGQTATLSVTATGAAPLSYQWYQGTSGTTTTPVGSNSSTFTTPALANTTSY